VQCAELTPKKPNPSNSQTVCAQYVEIVPVLHVSVTLFRRPPLPREYGRKPYKGYKWGEGGCLWGWKKLSVGIFPVRYRYNSRANVQNQNTRKFMSLPKNFVLRVPVQPECPVPLPPCSAPSPRYPHPLLSPVLGILPSCPQPLLPSRATRQANQSCVSLRPLLRAGGSAPPPR